MAEFRVTSVGRLFVVLLISSTLTQGRTSDLQYSRLTRKVDHIEERLHFMKGDLKDWIDEKLTTVTIAHARDPETIAELMDPNQQTTRVDRRVGVLTRAMTTEKALRQENARQCAVSMEG
jgi:hypothetical protein